MAYFLQHPDSDDDDAQLDFMVDLLNGYGDANLLHDVDMENLFFGGDDDDDYFDPDFDDQLDFLDHDFSDDSDYSDASDHNKIFISLQDSTVLRKLNFHKALGNGKFRLPKIRHNVPETYESLYKVLDELDIMLKVWKKRTEHVFTAHIQKGDEDRAAEDASGDDSSMRFGVDYSDSDIAHESDDGESEFRHRIGAWGNGEAAAASGASATKSSNEALTKKKYCQSTRLFYSVFDGACPDKKFEALSSFVRKAKRHVHSTIYSLFISAFPEEVGSKMPREIWEKVWRFTQTPYDEFLTYNAGFRFAEEGVEQEMERHRVTELFGAAGNLHMTVFEILFKHAYITRLPTLLGLESGLESFREATRKKRPASYAKTRFTRFKRLFERAFSQLLELQMHQNNSLQQEGQEVSHIQKIDAGQFTCRKHRIADFKDCKVDNKRPDPVSTTFYHGDKTGMVIAPSRGVKGEAAAEVLAVVQYDVDKAGTAMLAFDVHNARLGRTVARIEPGIPFVEILGSGLVFAQSGELTGDRLAFLLQTDDGNMPYRTYLYIWKFDPASETTQVMDKPEARIDCKMDVYAMGGVRSVTMKYVELGAERSPTYAVCMERQKSEQEGEDTIYFEVRFFDAQSQLELREKRIKIEKQSVTLECAKKNILIARYGEGGMTRKGHLAIDVDRGVVVGDYPWASLDKDAEHGHSDESYECVYEAKFDEAEDQDKFLIFSQNLTNFQLFDFSDQSEPPRVVHSGSSVVYELNWRRLNRTTLYDGVLYCGPRCDISVRAHCGDYFEDTSDARCVDLFAFDLKDCSVHPIVNLIESHNDSRPKPTYYVNGIDLDSRHIVHENDRVLTNEHSRSIYADTLYSGPPYFLSPTSLILPMHRSYVEVTLHPNSASAFKAEAEDVAEQRKVRAELLRKEAEAEEKRQKKIREEAAKKEKKREEENVARAALADTGEALKGRVKKWEYSYGFIEISEPKEHRKAGTIFAHISDFKNRGKKRIRKGQMVEFSIVSVEGGKFKANEVNLV